MKHKYGWYYSSEYEGYFVTVNGFECGYATTERLRDQLIKQLQQELNGNDN